MKIALASDHAGFDLKSALAAHFRASSIPFEDFGCGPGESVDYVDFAAKACEAVQSGACDRAVLVCGTGIGMALAANKFRGIRATPCWNAYTVDMSRRHNDSNCLTLGGRVLAAAEGIALADAWLITPFEGGRHARRLDKVKQLEELHFKR
jgi:ribose 5-phosphate isomerase B